MVQRFRKTRPWDVEAEPAPERKPLISAGEYSVLAACCACIALGWVLGAATLTAWGMDMFAGIGLALGVVSIFGFVRSRRGQP